ncbi:Ribosomal RNA small subunit methyltransferase I OS=Streptomyces antimycoticus OX=68175 GN=rsmI PE=3 SV=1 [Streptomyces antimycoticus]
MAEVFGPDRRAAVCRELTKATRGCSAARWRSSPPGSGGRARRITIVVEGAPAPGPEEAGPAELARRVAVREEAGERRKEAIAAVAQEAGLPKRQVFDAVVAAKNATGGAPREGKAP